MLPAAEWDALMDSAPPPPATETAPARDGGRIGRQIALGFGLIAAISIAMCAMLFGIIAEVSGLVAHMRAHESAINNGHALATAVREQYAHQAHTLIEGDDSHLGHYDRWVERVRGIAATLEGVVPNAERSRLDGVLTLSQQLDELFRSQMLPALKEGDRDALARVHREADQIAQAAARDADAVARAIELGMVHAHVSATRSTQLGFAMSALCVLLIVGISVGYTIHLRRAVLKPLAAIADSARRFGGGDFSVRAGAIGQGELRAVASAFDRMLDEISAREQRSLSAERMAAIGQLAAGVAHEINNPIGIIRGYLKTMTPDSAPDVLCEELRILDEEAAACQRITEDLLAYAKTPDLRIESVAVDELIREAVRRFEEAQPKARGRIVVRVEPSTVEADPGRIRQVVLNLLRNAIQASPPDARVEIMGIPPLIGDRYEIVVADRGPGVKPEDQPRIFEPFFSKRGDGSGLGLAVCQGIVRAHGGTIAVETRPGGGASFRVCLPGRQRPPAGGQKA
jgi:two-component system, NtrC family, sensor kinase